ncbi:gamma-aminobutyric acid receptor alpha-like, partial [Agrilus planipennis]|uniref:Gamma-aminobutyric acid receptor alpha-like n=1 Tax=Agrilus planipennis TaxID=224129 RepID=A0A1W4XD26_AGRPL
AYTSQDVVYQWNQNRQVAIAEDMKLSQFDLIATPASYDNSTFLTDNKKADYSMLLISFHLRRHMGNFLIQVYGPCVLLVVLSWVSFWLNREATADRVSLGITTVLTMTFLGLEARTDLPKVPYPTALDFFVFLSFTFIFATIIQFAVVHYFTKYGSGECYFNSDLSSETSSEDESEWSPLDIRRRQSESASVNDRGSFSECRKNSKTGGSRKPRFLENANGEQSNTVEVITLSACTIPLTTPSSRKSSRSSWNHLPCISCPQDEKTNNKPLFPSNPGVNSNPAGQHTNTAQSRKSRRKKKRAPRFNSVSKIDRASRVVFPLLFLTINLFYWYSYLSRTKRIHNFNVS